MLTPERELVWFGGRTIGIPRFGPWIYRTDDGKQAEQIGECRFLLYPGTDDEVEVTVDCRLLPVG